MAESKNESLKKGLNGALSILSSLIVALLPYVYFANKNFDMLGKKDLWLSLGIVCAHWFLVLLINLFLFREVHKASLATLFSVLLLSLFHPGLNFVNRVFPFFYYWHAILLVITLIVLSYLVFHKLLEPKTAGKINLILGIMFFGLIIINSVPTVFAQVKKGSAQRPGSVSMITGEMTSQKAKEELKNIYLFVFDEYSGHEGLLRYTGYDNSAFYESLEGLGFNTSKRSRTYALTTKAEVSNLLNLNFNASYYTEAEKNEILKDTFLFIKLPELGYDLNLINDQGFISTPQEKFKYLFLPQKMLNRQESLIGLLMEKSVYFPLVKHASNARVLEILQMFDYAKKSSTLQESGLFTFGYFMFPHTPWVVDENGNETNKGDRDNWKNPQVYLGQLKYANKLIYDLVETLIENDPNSTIFLLSDHGFRYPTHMYRLFGVEMEDSDLERFYMRNILNAVYVSGEKHDIEAYSGINTVRTVLDKMFNLGLGLIEEAN
jgi:hypothetical protein